ncbi:tetratricopeptide repeat protein [Magnetococcus sp. PR-3]|uniref:tetratricopeptide repeat protein n=1 Tax=Magnetococcus sp. PR-3 TaxID=3120355 RepID=UPI002FCE0CB7
MIFQPYFKGMIPGLLVLLTLMSGCKATPFPPTQVGGAMTAVHDPQSAQASWNTLLSQAKTHSYSASQKMALKGLNDLKDGELDAASKVFNQALKLDPRSALIHYLNGLTYHLQGVKQSATTLDLAEQGYKQALRFDTSFWSAHAMLGALYSEKGQHQKSLYHTLQALSLHGDSSQLLWQAAKAAYKTAKVDVAASMIVRLEAKGDIQTPRQITNAAIIMSAVGHQQKAAHYQAKLDRTGPSAPLAQRVDQRLADWQSIYTRYNTTSQTKPASPLVTTPSPALMQVKSTFIQQVQGFEASGEEDEEELEESLTDEDETEKSVVVDVVIIRSEETLNTAKGVNLLSGLQIQFGDSDNSVPAFRKQSVQQAADGTIESSYFTDTITRALTIPAITYTLNIVNANNQRNEILARPTILATSDQESEFFSGTELNAAAVATGAQGGESISIEKEIGVKLRVLPLFKENGQIQLQVYAERTFLKSPSTDVNFTFRLETSKTTVNANVIMRYGETVILSGLSEKESESSRDGVPGLQDIPVIQYATSRQLTKEFQKSVLILLTPRPVQYVYQPKENQRRSAQQTYDGEGVAIAALRARYSDWFRPYPNWASIFHHMQQNSLYREFRTGDVELEHWSNINNLQDRLKQALTFLWY